MLSFNILLSIAAVILFASTSSQIRSSTSALEQKRKLMQESILTANSNILELTNDATNWKQILSRNGALICVTRYLENNPPATIPPCTNNMSGTLNIYWPDGATLINSSSEQSFGLNGQACPLQQAGNCPWSIRLSWRIDCDSPCTDPIVYATSNISFNGNILERLIFNSKNYEFSKQIGPNSQNKWALCSSRNAVYLPQGFNGQAPDRQGCVDITSFNGKQGPPGMQGPPGTATLLAKRNSLTHCSNVKLAPTFQGTFPDAIEWQRLGAGLKTHFYPANGHCTGVALDVEIIGSKGTKIRIPCRPGNPEAKCFVYGGQTYIDVKAHANPSFDVTKDDLQPLIDNKEDLTEIKYDWAYNSGGAGATCFISVLNKASYGFALVIETNFDNKPSFPNSCTPSGVFVEDPTFFN